MLSHSDLLHVPEHIRYAITSGSMCFTHTSACKLKWGFSPSSYKSCFNGTDRLLRGKIVCRVLGLFKVTMNCITCWAGWTNNSNVFGIFLTTLDFPRDLWCLNPHVLQAFNPRNPVSLTPKLYHQQSHVSLVFSYVVCCVSQLECQIHEHGGEFVLCTLWYLVCVKFTFLERMIWMS